MNFRSLPAATLLLLILLIPGCGRKTALVPPQRLVPVRINDLRYELDENGVTLKWGYPTKMESGDELRAIETFEIFRAVVPENEFCQGCPVQYEAPVEIEGGILPPTGGTRTAVHAEGYLLSGHRYLYKVRSRSGWWYPSADSNIISFVWSVPPKIPREVELEPGDRTITLTWQPVREDIEARLLQDPVRYQVYRQSGSKDFAAMGEPVREIEFVDGGLENGRLYAYKVRAVILQADTLQPGSASLVVSGVPMDLIPPEQPQDLLAVEIPGGIKLVWRSVGTEDLAGYRIYRREEGAAEPELLVEVPFDQEQYIDLSAISGRKWFYSVTSFDAAQPVNESSPAAEAAVELR